MACRVVYTPDKSSIEIDPVTGKHKVFAYNNKPSELYEDILEEELKKPDGSVHTAFEQYMALETPYYQKLFSGFPTDKNGEFIYTDAIKSALKTTAWNKNYAPVDVIATKIKTKRSLEDLANIFKNRVTQFKSKNLNPSKEQDVLTRIEQLIKTMSTATANESLNKLHDYVEIAERTVNSFNNQIEYIRENMENARNLEQDDLLYLLNELSNINHFITSFGVLKDINKIYRTESRKDSVPTEEKTRIQRVLSERDALIEDYVDLAKGLITEMIFRSAEPFNATQAQRGDMSQVLSRKEIRDSLDITVKDIGYASNWLGATVDSGDAITDNVALVVKGQLHEIRNANIEVHNKLRALYASLTGPKNNPVRFNRDRGYITDTEAYEDVKIKDEKGNYQKDYNGEFITEVRKVKRAALTQEFRYDKFSNDRTDHFAALRDDETLDNLQRSKKAAAWINQNVDRIPNIQEVIEEKRKTLSESEYNKWIKRNTKSVSTYARYKSSLVYSQDPETAGRVLIYTNELVQPAQKYKNPKWDKVKDDPYYQALLETYHTANNALPYYKQLKHGILPQILSDVYDAGASVDGPSLKAVMEKKRQLAIGVDPDFDLEYAGNVKALQTITGDKIEQVPIYFTNLIDPKIVSEDLLQSVLTFAEMSNHYKGYSKVEPFVHAVSNVVLGNASLGIKGRQVAEPSSFAGKALKGMMGSLVPKKMESRANEKLANFVNMQFYGHMNKHWDFSYKWKGKDYKIGLDKLMDRVAGYSAATNLVGNFIASTNNVIFGNYSSLVMATAGEYMNWKTWAAAEGEYMLEVPKLIRDTGRITGKSRLSQMIWKFDAIQGNYQSLTGDKLSGDAIKRAADTDSLFIMTHLAEHQIQVTGMIAMMKHKKVKTKDGKEISLYDAYELDKSGHLKLKDGVLFSREEEKQFTNQLHALNKRMHGIYNSFDRSAIQAHWLGRMGMMFRKYIYTGFKSRWNSKTRNFELGDVEQGYYTEALETIYNDLKNLKFNPFQWSGRQKASVLRTLLEIGMMIGLSMAFASIEADDEDDPAMDLAALFIRRFDADIQLYNFVTNPQDMLRIVRSPAVVLSTFENLLKALKYTATGELYQKKTHRYKKGDKKSTKYWRDLMLLDRHFYNVQNPGELLEFYSR